MKRILILADEQIPYQIDLAPIERFAKDFKPDIVCRLGDTLDMEALSGWTSKSPKDVDWGEIWDEIGQANAMFDRQDKIFQCETHYWLGNHEERLSKFKIKHPDFFRKNPKLPDLMRDLKLKERKYKVHGQNQLIPFGKLYMFHGDDWNMFHTKNNVQNYEVNLVYGHVHSPQRFTKVARVTHSPKSAWSLGCLCSRDPSWKSGAPNSWVNGFAVAYIHDNGNFNLYPIDVVKGQFVAPNGKLYK